MNRKFAPVAVAVALAACSGNPLNNVTTTGNAGVGNTVSGSFTDSGITTSGDAAPRVSYNSDTDTLQVNNMPFDGNGRYTRDGAVPTMNGFRVYANTNTSERRDYQALYGASPSGGARAVIVRTGDYRGYGFGGFIFERDMRASLPSSGSATYSGNYAGMRTFDGSSGLTYTRGDLELEVDFLDFTNQRATMEGFISNREEYDTAGNYLGDLPVMVLATAYADGSGAFESDVTTHRINPTTTLEELDSQGKYYGVIAGPDADELVGIVVVQGDFPNDPTGLTFQEAGAFFGTRN
ncbi:MAG: hypothetical protein R3D84_06135 [Paracoccaceae bacterium]